MLPLTNSGNSVQGSNDPMAFAALQKIFESYIWELRYTSKAGVVHVEKLYFKEKYFVVNKSVLTIDGSVLKLSRSKITIHDLKINKDIIEFYKSNVKRDYSNIYTKLQIIDSNTLKGVDGEGDVEYIKMAKVGNRFRCIIRREF